MKKIVLALSAFITMTASAQQAYKAPPTSSTTARVPVISDAQMQKCVETYNKAEWLSKELNNTYVNQYDQSSVNAYNAKVNQHRQLTTWFNQNCAGKQSHSACQAANKLNRQQGLPEQSCR